LSQLPIDPVNTTSSDLYYAYVTNGQKFDLTSEMESAKYIPLMASDGGAYAGIYQEGASLTSRPRSGAMGSSVGGRSTRGAGRPLTIGQGTAITGVGAEPRRAPPGTILRASRTSRLGEDTSTGVMIMSIWVT
jgi:hypothetical protein